MAGAILSGRYWRCFTTHLLALIVAVVAIMRSAYATDQMAACHAEALQRLWRERDAYVGEKVEQARESERKRLWDERAKINALRDSLWREAAATCDLNTFVAFMHRRYDGDVWDNMTRNEHVDDFIKYLESQNVRRVRERPVYERNPLFDPTLQ